MNDIDNHGHVELPEISTIGTPNDDGTVQGSHIVLDHDDDDDQQGQPHQHFTPHHHKFSPFTAFCFTINYILGTGFLTIPWAFQQSGLILSVLLLVASAGLSDMSKDYLLETMAGAEGMLDANMNWKRQPQRHRLGHSHDKSDEIFQDEEEEMEQRDESIQNDGDDENRETDAANTQQSSEISSNVNTTFLVKDRKFEMNSLCRVFLGTRGVTLFTIFICLYMIGILWAYTSVFASAMADALPLFDGELNFGENYTFYAILFGAIVVPMSCLELDEQVPVQIAMTGCRFLMLFLMIGTAHSCARQEEESERNSLLQQQQQQTNNGTMDTSATTEYSHHDPTPWFRFSGLYRTMPILVVAMMYHPAIPGLAHPVTDKKALGIIFRSTSIFTSVAYSIIGVVLGSAFGTRVEESSNLNWKGFGKLQNTADNESIWWEEVASFYIMLFPALDVLSAFPLNAITLGNNMFGGYFGNKVHEMEHQRGAIVTFRLLASVPPLVGAIFVRELGEITDYAGTTGFIIGFTIPALLFLQSKYQAAMRHGTTKTYYTSYGAREPLPKLMFWFGIVMAILVLASLIFL